MGSRGPIVMVVVGPVLHRLCQLQEEGQGSGEVAQHRLPRVVVEEEEGETQHQHQGPVAWEEVHLLVVRVGRGSYALQAAWGAWPSYQEGGAASLQGAWEAVGVEADRSLMAWSCLVT